MKRLLLLVCILAISLVATCGQLAMADVAGFTEMQRGSKGDDVRQMQEALIGQGFLSGKADGDFGGMTESAVSDFQSANGLEVTGIVDETTLELLYALEAERKENIVLANGDSGADVSAVQERLIQLGYLFGKASGKFDDDTETAVIMFQRRNGLEQTGTVDKVVQAALYTDGVVEASRANVVVPQKIGVNMHYSSPYLHVDFKNNGTDNVDGVDIRYKLYNTYGERKTYYDSLNSFENEEEKTTFHFGGTIKAGGTATMTKKQELSLSGFRSNEGEKLELVKAAVSRYHTEDGNTYEIPEEEWIWYGSDGSVEVEQLNPGMPTGEMTPEIQEIIDKMTLGFEDYKVLKDYLAEEYGLPYGGLYVDDYVDDGIMKDIGVERGVVITNVDGYAVYTTDDLLYAIGAGATDGNVDVTFYKDGKEQQGSINTAFYLEGTVKAFEQEPVEEAAQGELNDEQETEPSEQFADEDEKEESAETNEGQSEHKVVEIPTGAYTVGEDIPAGDYKLTMKNDSLYIDLWGAAVDDYETNGGVLYYVVLDEENPVIGKITLNEGNVIQFDNTLQFEKYQGIEFDESKDNTVPAGIYIIGEDFPAGNYRMEAETNGAYYTVWGAALEDYETNGGALYYGDLDEEDPEVGKITLKDGNVLSLSAPVVIGPARSFDF